MAIMLDMTLAAMCPVGSESMLKASTSTNHASTPVMANRATSLRCTLCLVIGSGQVNRTADGDRPQCTRYQEESVAHHVLGCFAGAQGNQEAVAQHDRQERYD